LILYIEYGLGIYIEVVGAVFETGAGAGAGAGDMVHTGQSVL
jgi:hypothetical protein